MTPETAAPVSKQAVESYAWGDRGLGWHLLRTPELSVIEEEMPPGTSEAPHRHQSARQFFYVLRGELIIELDGVRHQLAARSGLEISPMLRHQVRNESDATVEFLVISQPASHGDRHE